MRIPTSGGGGGAGIHGGGRLQEVRPAGLRWGERSHFRLSYLHIYGSLIPAGLSRWKCTLASPSVSRARNLRSEEVIAAEVIRSHRLPTPLVWIEHWPEESTDGGAETFELVVFSRYEVEERVPYLGEGRA